MASKELSQKVTEWLQWDKNKETSQYINQLFIEAQYEKLEKILLNRLSFGTAGLRGRMAAGYGCMNDLVIIQTGQGLLKYLEQEEPSLLKQNGIVVGYDGRHNSKKWAEYTAAIFVHAGYKVKLFSRVNPTPFVPFAVNKYKAAIGVMVTASHNPKEDNGYKVYGSNATQIISPADKKIQESILKNLEPKETSWDISILSKTDLCVDPLEEIITDYREILDYEILIGHKEINKEAGIPFVYTAMHGVGFSYVEEIFKAFHLKLIPVKEQKDPDPDFPTVKFPNPEEGKSSLDLSIKTAEENNSNVILANDPDADRFCAAERDKESGNWKIFNGNELGALLGWWMLECFKQKHTEPMENIYMISSTVSSKILQTMAKKEGFNFEETLTGFKWMGNKAIDVMNKGKKMIFAFEESIGYMCGTGVLDKDGVSAAAHFATMVSFLYSQNKTISDKLQEIYSIYGTHKTDNSYFLCYDPEVINKIFKRIRNFNGPNTYPTSILNNKYKIKNIRDLTTGYDDNQPDKRAVLPVSKSSHMITFTFENGCVSTLRTSGTEPKIKYYNEIIGAKNADEAAKTLREMTEAICEELLQPKENGLIAKSD